MIKVYVVPFMEWFRIITDNEHKENKITALEEYKEAFFKAIRRKIYFVNHRDITISDEDVVNYNF